MQRLKRAIAFGLLGLLGCALLSLGGCSGEQPSASLSRLTVGIVDPEADAATLERYGRFQQYLAEQTQSLVELEPALNELRAVDQVQAQNWSLVFAPSGLAAIAIAEDQYLPIFPLQGIPNQRSVLITRGDSDVETITDLANQVVALGEPGSATGYYLPLYDLYGLTLAEIRFAPTPQKLLEWVAEGTVAAGALSEELLQNYRGQFAEAELRVLHTSRVVPPGAVLVSPQVERNQQRLIETAMAAAPADIAADAGYIPNAGVPDFSQLIRLVEKVRPLETQVRQQPAVLTSEVVGE